MFIRTDDNNNIVEIISVGVKPEKNGYEVEAIDETILSDILNYKYINGEFVKNENFRQEKIDEIKNIKISNLSLICQNMIVSGIDFNGSHYSLTEHDQLNLMKHSFSAILNPDGTFAYHADGEDCRDYTSTEIIQISTLAEKWKTYHLTYFNMIKSNINNTTDIDEVISFEYGMELSEDQETKLNSILTLEDGSIITFPREIINDGFDYNSLFRKVDVDNLIIPTIPEEEVVENNIDGDTNEENTV